MLDQSLLQSHFIGRDGFRWWIGQVPPVKDWQEQADQEGWGLRVKVRILGYHSLDPNELSNQDLPWAQVMLPTTAGSGGAFYAVNPKITQGDMVIGFFLDGDNAQMPIIIGTLGRTSEWSQLGYQNPFTPFTGFTNNIRQPDRSMLGGSATNESNTKAQETPIPISPQNATPDNPTSFSGTGDRVVFANTCENTTQAVITAEINNLIRWIQKAQAKVGEYQQKVDSAAEVIRGALGWLVGEIFKKLDQYLVGTQENPGIIPVGIQGLYTTVYGSVLAATGEPKPAHEAGVKVENALIGPIQILEKALVCAKNAVLDEIVNLIKEVLYSLLENVKSFVSCAAEQFIGVILNVVVDQISNAISSALDGVLGVLGIAFDVASFLREAVGLFTNLLDCGQSNKKCDGTKEWIVGVGPVNEQPTKINNILNRVNELGSLVNSTIESASGVVGSFQNSVDAINSTVDIFNGNSSVSTGTINSCYTGTPTSCGPPTLKIFGGGGIDGEASPIFGAIIKSTSAYQNVTQTASIIGAKITNAGSGYRFPPFVEITDNCGLGYGAKARSVINDKGELEAIYIVSAGTNYPIGNQEPSGVTGTVIQSSGLNYSDGDIATDNFGNEYELTIEDGKIIEARPLNSVEIGGLPKITVNSDTGFGAVISPVFGRISSSTKLQTQIDCPI